jgi:arsenite transporter
MAACLRSALALAIRLSFLPLALALPPSFEQTAVVFVFQSLIVVYLWWVPGRLFPMPPHDSTKI